MVSFLPGLALMKTTVLESMRTLSYFRLDTLTMSPWTYCPTAQCSPGHSAIVQTVPLSAKCPPMLIVLGRVYKGAIERTGQFEVSSIKEDSMETI